MRIKNLLILLLILYPSVSFSQSIYQVGTSQEAIEPDQSLISLHLGGYGAPKDGRFTLHWVKIGAVPEIIAISGLNDKLFIVSKEGDLLSMDPSDNSGIWRKVGKAQNIRSIAGSDNSLYGISDNRELLKARVTGRVKWEKIGTVDPSVTAIAAFRNKLYVVNGNGATWSADLWPKRIEWIKEESISNSVVNIVSLTSNNKKIFALTSDDVIYQCEPGSTDSRWIKTA